jgi:hypothetical protein
MRGAVDRIGAAVAPRDCRDAIPRLRECLRRASPGNLLLQHLEASHRARVLEQVPDAIGASQAECQAQRLGGRLAGFGLAHQPCELMIHLLASSSARQPFARFCRISNAGKVLPSSTSRNAPPPVEM